MAGGPMISMLRTSRFHSPLLWTLLKFDPIFRHADLIDISRATNIRGTRFDNPANPVSPGGILDKRITPAKLTEFVDFIDQDQLARFGLHTSKFQSSVQVGDTYTAHLDEPNDRTLINAKWESFTLAPVYDSAFPNDYFLFIAVS